MPAFQRGFVWDRRQILELLQSIYRGFPIGSLLLWKVKREEMKIEGTPTSLFPSVEETFPTNYILDGLQRLTTLYAVFHYNPKTHDQRFAVSFDLQTLEFTTPVEENPSHLPLNVLFRPHEFIALHSKLAKTKNTAPFIKNAVALLTTFQEYLIPIVTIEGRPASEVVQIFERINTTGTRLGAVDFIRAATWKESFDLNKQLQILKNRANEFGFSVPAETLVKAFAIALGLDPISESMLQMKDLPAKDLEQGMTNALGGLDRTVQFLREQLNVHAFSLIPYEGQFLAIFGFFRNRDIPGERMLNEVARWYWIGSLNEDMQGRSEHLVAKMVGELSDFREGRMRQLPGRLTLIPGSLLERRFRWGSALSSSFAGLLAKRKCRSLITGSFIPVESFLADDAGKNYVGLEDSELVSAALGRNVPAGKIVANVVVAADADLRIFRKDNASTILRRLKTKHPDKYKAILESQLLTEGAVTSLIRGRSMEFLTKRANSIMGFAKNITSLE
jgi:hypothetical protein